MTCRVFGPPVRMGAGDALGHCELCFNGATTDQVAACEMAMPHDLEQQLIDQSYERRNPCCLRAHSLGLRVREYLHTCRKLALEICMQTRSCWVEISTRSLENNYRFLESLALATPNSWLSSKPMPTAFACTLRSCGGTGRSRWIAVTSVEEGMAARALCPQTRVMVIGGVVSGQGAEVVNHGLTAVVWESAQVDDLEAAARTAGLRAGSLPLHLEIDTGMSRQGTNLEELPLLLARFVPGSRFRLEAS